MDVRRRGIPIALALALAAFAGCAKPAERPASTLTEAQRDSVLAREPIPGASVVDRALKAAAGEQRHANAMDTLGQ
ncbi:MAG TPA: hypothetical protein VMH61_06050 [Candidatus Acidoferrales bacterium]|nr:hypothetical protein [Candidatus Acidoferrales bacterium]